MQDTFGVLGVTVDLRRTLTEEAVLVVSNTEERVREIKGHIERIIKDDAMSAAEASQLRGRLGFSNSQTFGREGAYAFKALGVRAAGSGAKTNFHPTLKEALLWWARHFDMTKPRKVRLRRDQVPVYIFTDGSCEDQGEYYPEAEVGGVIYDPTVSATLSGESYPAPVGEAIAWGPEAPGRRPGRTLPVLGGQSTVGGKTSRAPGGTHGR